MEDKEQDTHRPLPQSLDLASLTGSLRTFAAERDWDQFHTPRNLLLALTAEVGELNEVLQWRGEVAAEDLTQRDRQRLGEEASDVLCYLVRFCDKAGIDLATAVAAKLEQNSKKYPADQCRGKSDKYTAYQ
jgi:dCTP diphosphatase